MRKKYVIMDYIIDQEDVTMDNMENNYENMQNNYGSMQNNYENSNYNPQNVPQEDRSVMSMGDWLITLLILLIPCAGIIVYFVWAFGKNGNVNRRNYCRAYLIYWAVTCVILLIIMIVVFSLSLSTAGNYYYY